MGVSPFRVVVRSGQEQGKTFPLPPEGVVRVGSARPCQIVIAAPGVLAAHFFLKCGGGRVAVIVQDENAKVLLNGAPVRKKLLEPGDSLQAGEAVLVLEAVERDPLLGQTVGGYRIDALIGRGAMGTVYKSTQLSLDRTVALKILSPELTRDAAFVAKFLEEAKAAAKLNHPNVVQIYDAAAAPMPDGVVLAAPAPAQGGAKENGPAKQIFFFSMEHMPGGTLQKVLDKEGKTSLERSLAIGCDTAKALVWAEEHGIVHRDIKPANLLFAADGSVKVADLGIAADIDRMMEGVDGVQGSGSPRYMAPEQAQRKGVDHRADLYALGSTLFRAISGRHVFEDKAALDVIKAKTTQDAPRLDAVAPDVPPEVADIIQKMLSREISGRPRTCAETLATLEDCLALVREESASEAGSDDPVRSAASRGAGNRSRLRRGRGGAGVVSWGEFVASPAGKASLSVSTMLVMLALFWPVSSGTTEAPGGGSTGADARNAAGARTAATVPEVHKETDREPDRPPDVVPRVATKESGTRPDPGTLKDPVLSELGGILQEYRSGLIDQKRAMSALEDFKRKHPEPEYADRASTHLSQIRDGLVEAGKNALSRLINGDLHRALEQGDYRSSVNLLVKLGEAHPLILKEINAEVAKVEDAARADLKKAEDDANKAASAGDFAGAISALKNVEPTLPASIQGPVTEKITRLTQDQKEFAELSGPFAKQLESVADAVASLDFTRASTQSAALPQPVNALLAKRRATIVAEVQRCRAAWDALSAANRRPDAKTNPKAILSTPPKELLALLGSPPQPDQLEGLGLLLLYVHGPEPAKGLLLDSRLGAEKSAAYKARLAEEEEAYLSRYARGMLARIDQSKAPGAAPPDWNGLAAEILARITAARSSRGYDSAKAALATAFLKARAEVLRASVPSSLFKGKVKSYKPDGSIELVYEFTTEDELKDFIAIGSPASRLELDEKTAKMRGEIRLGRGDVFRNRLGVTAKLTNNGYSTQAPNINVALWTRDGDRLGAATKRSNGLDPEPEPGAPTRGGVARDYIAFGIGCRPRLPNGSAQETLNVKGSDTPVVTPANAIFGGLRGEPIQSSTGGDCLWAKPSGKVSGAQVMRVVMVSGAITWSINTRALLTARDLKDLEVLKREEPYIGSVTFFTNGEVLSYDSIIIEGELNPAWVEERLLAAGETDLKKAEPDYPFRR